MIKSNTRLFKLNNDDIPSENDAKGEDITLLWCDNNLEKEQLADDIALTRAMLNNASNSVYTCSSKTKCLTYLNTFCKLETVILIVSGTLASKALFNKVNVIRQVDTIFIFCIDTKKYERFLQYPKVAGIFNERETLKYNIMKTMRAIERQSAILQLYDTTKQKLVHNLIVKVDHSSGFN